MNKRTIVAALVAAAALALTGCGGSTATPGAAKTTPAATSSPSGSLDVETEAPSGEEDLPGTDKPGAFGETFTFEDGLEVTVGKPAKFKPSEYAATGKGTHLKFTVVIKNGTKANYDPSLFFTTLSSGESEAESIYDTDKGIEGGPSTTIRPGKSAKFVIGYSVKNPKDLTMEVNPGGFDYSDVLYTNVP